MSPVNIRAHKLIAYKSNINVELAPFSFPIDCSWKVSIGAGYQNPNGKNKIPGKVVTGHPANNDDPG
jgi:hypothetical protein